jgi:hypothetical protein
VRVEPGKARCRADAAAWRQWPDAFVGQLRKLSWIEGRTPDGRSGKEFRQLIDADIKAYADVVRAANLKFD